MTESIVFLGTNLSRTSISCLSQILSKKYTVAAVITIKEKNYFFHSIKEQIIILFTRRENLKNIAKNGSIPFFVVKNINSDSSAELIKSVQPALICSCIFGQILKKNIIEIPTLGTINVHPSLLPKYRGSNPYFWVIKNGEANTGITIHYVDEHLDTGDVIVKKVYTIPDGISIKELQGVLAVLAADSIIIAIRNIFNDTVEKIPQTSGTRYPPPVKSDYYIDINREARYIYNFVKAIKQQGPLLKINNKDYYIIDAIDYKIISHNNFPSIQIKEKIVYIFTKDGIVRLKSESPRDALLRILGLKKIFNIFSAF